MVINRGNYLNQLIQAQHNGMVIVVVGDHTITYHDHSGITFINIYNFMLDENSLHA